MLTELNKIKDALSAKDMGANLNYYYLHDGILGAGNGRVSMGTPIDLSFSALLPGTEIELLANRLPSENLKVILKESHLTLSAGRTWGRVPVLPIDQISFLKPEHDWTAPPPNFLDALKAIRPFIAEIAARPWGTCACLRNNGILGTNNIVIAEVDCPGLAPPESLLVPVQAIDLIVKPRDGVLDGLILQANYIALRWSDGTWLRAQLIGDKFPEDVASKFFNSDAECIAIEESWRKECAALAEMTESILSIEVSRIHGGRGKARVECAIESPVQEAVHFNPKFLSPVMAVATEWALGMYPKPVLWRGDGIRGIILGRQA